jgi:phosphoribosyl-AMP cyclohydrolase / phosphoribosyl-ATP pyrophosphohydrolase
MIITTAAQIAALDFSRTNGLLPVIAQHAHTGEVLMLAWANGEALERTLRDGVMWYWSRSRSALWQKGESSGNVQRLVSLHADCDADALVARVLPDGPSCHTGAWSCFDAPPTLAELDAVIGARAAGSEGYTQKLLADENLRLKKLGEEAVELAVACAHGAGERAAEEAADLLYHVLAACRATGVGLRDVLGVLAARRAVSAAAEGDAAAGGGTTSAG